MKQRQKPFKTNIILFTMLLIIISASISPVLATGNSSESSDSPWPILGQNSQNTGQSPYLGAQNNTTKWTHNLTDGESNQITGGAVIGKDGTIYFGMDYYNGSRTSSKLYALHPNGTAKWNITIDEGTNSWGIVPTIGADGTIYFVNQYDTSSGMDESFYAFDSDGKLKWRYNFTDGGYAAVIGPNIGSDGILYLAGAFDNGDRDFVNFYGFYPNGTLKWNRSVYDGESNDVWTFPAIGKDGSIYFGTYFNNDTGIFGNLYALNPDGSVKWNYTPPNINITYSSFAPSVGPDGTIYIGTTNYNSTRDWINLFALNPDGTLKWNQTFFDGLDNWIFGSTSVSSDGIIYFLSNFENSTGLFGNLYALNPDGSVKWNYITSNGMFASPVIGLDGTIYTALSDGILALNSDGTKKWFYEVAGANGLISIDKNGTLYFPVLTAAEGGNGILYAIKGQQSYLYVKTSVDKTNPKIGDKITITFKVGNNGPDTAYDTVMKFIIPAGLKFISASVDSGEWSYDAATRTITWDLGDVPVGDPYLRVLAEILSAGTYTIQPILNTLTYDPDIASNTQTIVVNAQGNTPEHNPVKAVIKTVAMQETGVPISMIALAILMVLGGLAGARRR